MNGWNSARPTWDPRDGTGDDTPDFPDRDDYGLRAYGRPDHGPSPYGQPSQPGQPGQQGQPDYDPEDFWRRDQASPGGYDSGTNGHNGYNGHNGFSGHNGYETQAPQGFDQDDYQRRDYGPRHGEREYAQPGHADRGYAGRDSTDRESAARMDPALQDFFAPQPPRPDYAPGQQRSGQPQRPAAPGTPPQRQPGQPPQGFQGPQPPQAGQAPWAAQSPHGQAASPWPGQTGQNADFWNTPAPRAGSRSGSRSAQREARGSRRRGLPMVGIIIGVVVVLGIVGAGAYLVLHKHSTTPQSLAPTTAPPRSSASASATQHTGSTTSAKGTAYTLSTPATAGGYQKLTTAPPSSVSNVATATATSVHQQAVTAGGKVTGQVTGYYQLSSGQVMSFTGYEGTFDPTKVLASLGQVGQGAQTYSAGSHGGDLACIPSAGTPGGTVCVWVTSTTLGVTEFFASTGAPETVTNQSKAAQDTVNFRADAEAAKS